MNFKITFRSVTYVLFLAFVLGNAVNALSQCTSITTYGGSGNGTTNNSPALTSAFAALPATGGCISFPAGRYLFNTAVTLTYPATGNYSVSLVGAGLDNTTLYFPASNGITMASHLAQQTTHVSDLTFSTGSAGGYSALILNNSDPMLGVITSSDIDRTDFRGDDGGAATDYWDNGVKVVGQSNVNFDSDTFLGNNPGTGGTGISLSGNSAVTPYFGIVYNISKCGFFWEGSGLSIVTDIQGVTVTQSNFTNGQTGINALSGGTGLTQLAITGGNQFNTSGNQIVIAQPLYGLIMSGNLIFISEHNSGLWLDNTGGPHTITNNIFSGGGGVESTGTTGIYVSASNPSTVVTDNSFNALATGVNLTGTSGWNVQANIYNGVTTQVSNIGANYVGVVTK